MHGEKRSWRFGVLSFTGTGHLNPLIALAQELKSRGHKVTFFERAKIAERILDAGLDFFPLSRPQHAQSEPPPCDRPGIVREFATLRFNLRRISQDVEHYLAETPAAILEVGIDALLVNEIALTGPTVAQLLGLPYFLISTSVPHHLGWKSSSWLTGYRYSATAASWLQGLLLEVSALRVRGPLRTLLDRFRHKARFGPTRQIGREYPCIAHLTQLPECLGPERRSTAGNLYSTGPWLDGKATLDAEFPWNKLDGRPIAYVTMGTTRNAQPAILRMIAEACRDLDLQPVISLGNRFDPEQFADLPGQPLVVKFAPQLELLKIASIAITHGGPNTAFETLMEGKPTVAIPLAYDQPAIAWRLKRLKAAEVLPVMRLSIDRIQRAVIRVLSDPKYREAAERIQASMRSTQGAKRAADIIEVGLSGYAAEKQSSMPAKWVIDKQRRPQNAGASYSRN
ncbi:MAG: nucleotide disphospho-sugar-binding domain-containing protein [Terracidiphilus sp.]